MHGKDDFTELTLYVKQGTNMTALSLQVYVQVFRHGR